MCKQKAARILFSIVFIGLPISFVHAYNYEISDENASSPSAVKNQDVSEALDAYDPDQAIAQESAAKSQPSIDKSEANNSSLEPLEPRVPSAPVIQKSFSKEIKDFINPKEHEVEFGTEISHITYQEPEFELKDRGVMYGIYGVYTYRPKKDDLFKNAIINMYRLDAKWSFGQVDYTSIDGHIEGIEDYMFETRLVFGYDYYFTSDFRATPYLGLGYRRLSDDSSGKMTETNKVGYGRVSNYLYIPIGIEFTRQLENQWRVGGTGEFDAFIWGQQDSLLSDAGGPDLHNHQKNGLGMRASLKVAKLGDKYNFSVEPFVRYWHIKNSEISAAVDPSGEFALVGLEPNNKSTEVGAKVGVQF